MDGAEAPSQLLWKKNIALLLYLARSPKRRCTREQLIGLLWPDKDDAAARQSMREAIRVLRQYVGKDRFKATGDVVQLLDGAVELGEAQVDDQVIDEGLRIIRKLWDAGLAHRDIKPANVLVRDGKVLLIDLAFAELRPSPWRQAVDLANMLLVLALRSDPERVYGRAVRVFSPDEVAEAFAATRGIALTSQLRARLRLDGRDLISRFRQLAPPRTPIPIQRWSIRRIGLTATVLGSVLVAFELMLVTFSGRSLI